MFCKYCGNTIDDDTVFCPHCGKQLTVATNSDPSSNANYQNGGSSYNANYQNTKPGNYDSAGRTESQSANGTWGGRAPVHPEAAVIRRVPRKPVFHPEGVAL